MALQNLNIGRKEIKIMFGAGFLLLAPLVSYDAFNGAKQLLEYSQTGVYHTNCQLFYFPTFTEKDFPICERTSIAELLFSFIVSSAIALTMLGMSYKIINEVRHK